jgi:TM2 domain-containing membrane protein YozV
MSETDLDPYEDDFDISDKNRLLAALLALVFGVFGAHRFYVGKTGTAVVQLLSAGGLGIWFFIDFIIILFGEFKDADGFKIKDW